VLNDVSIANCCSGLPRIPAVYRTPRPIASTHKDFFSTLLGAPLRIVTVFEPAPEDLGEPGHFTRHHGPPVDPDVYLGSIERGVDGQGLASVSTASIPDPVGVTDGMVGHLARWPAGLLVVGGGRHKGLHAGTVRELLRTVSVPMVVVNRQDR
jgi:hypothetical protein